MGRYQAYPEYKDSGGEWLGAVPNHWNVVSCRGLVKNKVDKNEGALDQNYLSVMANVGVITYEEKGDVGNKKPDDLSKCKIVKKGNLVINSMNYAIGSYGMSAYDGVCSPVYIVLEPLSEVIESRFALRVFENKPFQKYLSTFGNGILEHRAAIGWDDIKGAYVAVPPTSEQLCILSFLDHETAKIDTLIEQQQQLIQLLKEKRQAVISHAVTKGLNPDAPMKDSGVEWLGEVPAHWKLPKIKWFCKTESGGTPNTGKYEEFYLDGEVPWIRTTDLNNNDLMDTPIKITQKAVNDSACALLPINSVLIAMYGGSGSIGKHSLLKFESTINQAVCAVLPNQKILPEFLHLYVEFYRPYWMVGAEGTRKDPNINQDTIRELVTPCPPMTEQAAIVAVTKKSLSTIDSIIEQSESNIELMQERRTALISAAVTGKIDVRNWQAPQQ